MRERWTAQGLTTPTVGGRLSLTALLALAVLGGCGAEGPRDDDAAVPWAPGKDAGQDCRKDCGSVVLCVPGEDVCRECGDDCGAAVSCAPGEEVLCYDGAAGTHGVGTCVAGVMRCGGDGAWGPCREAVGPRVEHCDGVDDDCDGATDEEALGSGGICGITRGECVEGRLACEDGEMVCAGGVGPTDETCNGLDDDCDGMTDESFPGYRRPCGLAVGACEAGWQGCVQGRIECLEIGRGPSPEVCDGLDNDCNGLVDDTEPPCSCVEGDQVACGTDEGECTAGSLRCRAGVWGPCEGAIVGVGELCNGLDDDCDGVTDDDARGEGEACGSAVGRCEEGARACILGEMICFGGREPILERCNGLDDDCDGETDEDPVEAGGPCGATVGECRSGISTCVWGEIVCEGVQRATPELCNGLDDDCDGSTDEEPTDVGGACGSDLGECIRGRAACQDGELVCTGGLAPAAEVCDGRDNDCNGTPDDRDPPCACREGEQRLCGRQIGECRPGVQSCVDGAWQAECIGAVEPEPERCDGLDRDCDGHADSSTCDRGVRRYCEGSERLSEDCALGGSACVVDNVTGIARCATPE